MLNPDEKSPPLQSLGSLLEGMSGVDPKYLEQRRQAQEEQTFRELEGKQALQQPTPAAAAELEQLGVSLADLKPASRGWGRTHGEELAQAFHEAYEDLAPDYGYSTREASRKPWADVPEQNKRLMIATADRILQQYPALQRGSVWEFDSKLAEVHAYEPKPDPSLERIAGALEKLLELDPRIRLQTNAELRQRLEHAESVAVSLEHGLRVTLGKVQTTIDQAWSLLTMPGNCTPGQILSSEDIINQVSVLLKPWANTAASQGLAAEASAAHS